jgi:hypothetical protein
MPLYTFQHPKTQEFRDVFFHMTDEKKYIDENGVKWDRVFYPPTFAFDTRLDPHDPNSFKKKTERGGTIGELFDLSKELSEKRGGDKNDEIKVRYEKDRNKKLAEQAKENLKKEQKKQLKEFLKLDKSRPKIKKKSKSN